MVCKVFPTWLSFSARDSHCRPSRNAVDVETLIQGQLKVVGTEAVEAEDGGRPTIQYLVETLDPSNASITLQLLLPHAEIQKTLLLEYEKKLLPLKSDNRNLKRKPQMIKGPRQLAW